MVKYNKLEIPKELTPMEYEEELIGEYVVFIKTEYDKGIDFILNKDLSNKYNKKDLKKLVNNIVFSPIEIVEDINLSSYTHIRNLVKRFYMEEFDHINTDDIRLGSNKKEFYLEILTTIFSKYIYYMELENE